MTSSPHIARVDDDSVPAIRHATRLNFEYLVATLSKRTRDKKYENFVINYIWNILGDPTLKPVTQQYVNRRVRNHGLGLVNFDLENAGEEDADHALIDLYFPSLRLGVECDEASHFDRRDNDERRTADIERAIVGYEEHRVQVEKDENGNAVSPDAVLAQIDDVVARIRQRKAEVEAGKYEWAQRGFSAWESDQVDWRLALREGVLRAGDGFMYSHNGEVRELFGRGNGVGTRRSSFSRNFNPQIPGYVVWIPSLAKRGKDGQYRSTNSGGYLNRVFVRDEVLIGQANPSEESARAREKARKDELRPLPQWEYSVPNEERARRSNVPCPPADWDPRSSDFRTARRITFVSTRDAVGRLGIQFLGVFSPPLGHREVEGISYRVCRLESDTFTLTGSVGGAGEQSRLPGFASLDSRAGKADGDD